MSAKTQNEIFLEREADAWFERNSATALIPVPDDHFVLRALDHASLGEYGQLLDIGGSAGKFSAGFLRNRPKWTCHVVEPSKAAIKAGSQAFPKIQFTHGNIGQRTPLSAVEYDVVIVAGVLAVLDRRILAQAIANVDSSLRDGGYLVISDFDSPYPRKNSYKHVEGLHTFKQDYAKIFLALETYHVISRSSVSLVQMLSSADLNDPYDQQWCTTLFRKDIGGRYSTSL